MSSDNVRAFLIFSSYLLICFLVAALIIRSLVAKTRRLLSENASLKASQEDHGHRHSRLGKAALFAVLAVASLSVTWYFMFFFFRFSYREWTRSQSHGYDMALSDWLKDSSLFEEAWSSAMATPERFWWTQQIFIFTTLLAIDIGFVGER